MSEHKTVIIGEKEFVLEKRNCACGCSCTFWVVPTSTQVYARRSCYYTPGSWLKTHKEYQYYSSEDLKKQKLQNLKPFNL